jgi:hypothetical protein
MKKIDLPDQMLFGEAPKFASILEVLRKLEAEINSTREKH